MSEEAGSGRGFMVTMLKEVLLESSLSEVAGWCKVVHAFDNSDSNVTHGRELVKETNRDRDGASGNTHELRKLTEWSETLSKLDCASWLRPSYPIAIPSHEFQLAPVSRSHL